MSFILGIDTGGTYTDSVILDSDNKSVIAKGKALTTKNSLKIGIEKSILSLGSFDYNDIDFISLSTTLATNAIVENKLCKTGLILTGKANDYSYPADFSRHVGGLMNIRGREQSDIDYETLKDAVEQMNGYVDSVAISGYASIRNPSHELKIKEYVEDKMNVQVVCAYELSSTLGLFERTITAVFNAGLIPIIKDWLISIKKILAKLNINAPVMIVKSDGSLMQDSLAKKRPVETMLSGPAASIMGAVHLSSLDTCHVLDMGGTTTDVAYVKNGYVKTDEDGATIGGFKTHVKAAAITTFGLGGDSHIKISSGEIKIGPEKVTPFCIRKNSELIANSLEYESQGIYGFTPTDICHIEGNYAKWDPKASVEGVDGLAKSIGMPTEKLLENAKQKFCNILSSNIPKGVVVAIGAPILVWTEQLKKDDRKKIVIPPHYEVANAIGAGVGKIIEAKTALIRYIYEEKCFVVYTKEGNKSFPTLAKSKDYAKHVLKKSLQNHMISAGGSDYEIIENENDIYSNEQEGFDNYIESRISMSAVSEPRFIDNYVRVI